MSGHVAPWTSGLLHAQSRGDFIQAAQPCKARDTNSTRWNCFGLLPRPIQHRLTLFASRIPTELRASSQACIFNRVQAFLRIYKNSLCLTCTKPKCNALLKQDSKIKTTAKHYLQPKTHFAIRTQARRKYCSSTSLLFFKNQDTFGNDALFPLFK